MYLLSKVLNFNFDLIYSFLLSVLYRKNCKKSFVQITEEGIRPKYFLKCFFCLTIIFSLTIRSQFVKYSFSNLIFLFLTSLLTVLTVKNFVSVFKKVVWNHLYNICISLCHCVKWVIPNEYHQFKKKLFALIKTLP